MYLAPDGSYTATFPSLRRRLAAGTIDWVICWVLFLLASIVAGILRTIGSADWEAGSLAELLGSALLVLAEVVVVAPVVVYFAAYWTRGSTLGMRAADIELVREETAVPPGWARALPRAGIALALAFAANNVVLVATGRALGGTSSFERALIAASVVVAVIGAAAKAWMLVDARGRSLLDRLFGLAYVEEIVFTRIDPSPWTGAWR